MTHSHWHKIYTTTVAATPDVVFDLLADLPNYHRWLPGSDQFDRTTDVEPYPVRLGSRYHDGQPDRPGRDWYGTVTGFRPPGALDFHQVIPVKPLLATVDVRIHYSLEPEGEGTRVERWLVLDIAMPYLLRPLRAAIIRGFDRENRRTVEALRTYADASRTG